MKSKLKKERKKLFLLYCCVSRRKLVKYKYEKDTED